MCPTPAPISAFAMRANAGKSGDRLRSSPNFRILALGRLCRRSSPPRHSQAIRRRVLPASWPADDHDGFGHRSTTLSLALRARGLKASSLAVAVTGFLVRTVSLGLSFKCPLDSAVFERVKADDSRSSAQRKQIGYHFECGVELAELIVDRNTQCLKDPG